MLPVIIPKTTAAFHIHIGKKTIQYDHLIVLSKRNENNNVNKQRQINTKHFLKLI